MVTLVLFGLEIVLFFLYQHFRSSRFISLQNSNILEFEFHRGFVPKKLSILI